MVVTVRSEFSGTELLGGSTRTRNYVSLDSSSDLKKLSLYTRSYWKTLQPLERLVEDYSVDYLTAYRGRCWMKIERK
jgi:hypothetical protein